jgi:FHA domain
VTVPRPTLGVLRLSTGGMIPLDRGVLLGRSPRLTADMPPGSRPHVLQLPSPANDISRNHAEVILDGWNVLVRDLGSTNGTTAGMPGQEPVRLRAGEPRLLQPGEVFTMAEEITVTFELRQ